MDYQTEPLESPRPLGTIIPTTDMRHLYLVLKEFNSLECQAAIAQEAQRVAVAERLAERFHTSVEQFSSYCNMKEPFYPRDRPDIPQSGQAQTIDGTYSLTSLLVHQQGGTCRVIDAPHLNFTYVDREIIPARTTGGARYSDGRPAIAGKRLDWLLANAQDRRPIIAEVKVANDMNPFYALIQTLTYAAELVTVNQAIRLQRHYPQLHFPELDNLQEDIAPAVDIYLVLAEYDLTNADRCKLLESTEHLCKRLISQPFVTSHVRRIACLDAILSKDSQLHFRSRFCYSRNQPQ